jgi:hypothetical protein
MSTLKLTAVGDLAFVGRFDHDSPPNPFTFIAPSLTESDLVIANLESPLIDDGEGIPGKCTLRGNPDWAVRMRSAGIDCVSLANNHIMDFGEQGLFSTMVALQQVGIAFVGAGHNREEANAPVFLKRAGRSLAILGRTSVFVASRCFAGERKSGAAWLDFPETIDAIRRCRQEADQVVLLIHWGLEEYRYPSPIQRRWAQEFVTAGASLVIGHHPHVMQGIEKVDNSIVAYSLGNFVFDNYRWTFVGREGEKHDRLMTLSDANSCAGILNCHCGEQEQWHYHFVPTRLDPSGTVVRDKDQLREREMKRLCSRLILPNYRWLWKMYAASLEWRLRIFPVVGGKLKWKNLRKIRLDHFRQLLRQIKRAVRISSGKSSNPYD